MRSGCHLLSKEKERNAGAIESGEKDDNGDGSHCHKKMTVRTVPIVT
jgi:hypothetical protein